MSTRPSGWRMRSVPPLSTYVASGRACVLTLAELQDIARDVGIAPELVVRATASLGEVGSAPTRTLLARALAIRSNLGSVRGPHHLGAESVI